MTKLARPGPDLLFRGVGLPPQQLQISVDTRFRPLVYLAGPISGSTYDDANDWRAQAARQLSPPILALSPLRAKAFLAERGVLGSSGYDEHPLTTSRGVVARDHFDVSRSDLVLVNFGSTSHVSIGTCIELGWASAYHKPIVTVLAGGGRHDHAFIRELSGWVTSTLDEAIELVKAILLP